MADARATDPAAADPAADPRVGPGAGPVPGPLPARPPAPPLNPADEAFAAHLPEGLRRPLEPRYLEEPRGRAFGRDGILVAPRNVGEVAAVVRLCAAARVGIVPYGGGTGLVGGQVMAEGPAPLILSLERMHAIRRVDTAGNVLIAEAGATLAAVRAAAEEAGRLFPLSIGSEGTAQIGGNLSTNAGGVNVLRYGNARELCLGLEAVLPDGSIWHGLKRLRKDNTGYDLRGLLIGAEGTLGIITAAALRLAPRPGAVATALIEVSDPAAALALLALAEAQVPGGVLAFELISRQGLLFIDEVMPELRLPLEGRPDWAVLVEIGLAAGADVEGALEALYMAGAEAGLAGDGVIAGSLAQREALWILRESLPLANRKIGAIASHDVSLPLDALAEFIARAGPLLAGIGPYRVNCFGHVGDGNLHYNVFPPPGERAADHVAARGRVTQAIHDLVHALEGSVSAEHGIGRFKRADLSRYGDPARLAAMRAIKGALDPQGIMNPGALFAP